MAYKFISWLLVGKMDFTPTNINKKIDIDNTIISEDEKLVLQNELELLRIEKLTKARNIIIYSAIVIFFIFIILPYFLPENHGFDYLSKIISPVPYSNTINIKPGGLFIFIFLLMMVTVFIYHYSIDRLITLIKDKTAYNTLNRVCTDLVYTTERQPQVVEELKSFVVTPYFNELISNDVLFFKLNNVDVQVYEVTLNEAINRELDGKKQKFREQVFKGIAVVTNVKKNFKGNIVIRPNKINTIFKSSHPADYLNDIELESEEFNQFFKVKADNQVVARYIITPSFMQKLINIVSNTNMKHISGEIMLGFSNQKLLILIPTKEGFINYDSVFDKIYLDLIIYELLNDFKSIKYLLEELEISNKSYI
jgi:hypothetical protein